MGMGHLVRALALAEAFSDHFHVVLLSGGELPREIKLPPTVVIKSLPPLALRDGQLISHDASYTLQEVKQTRTSIILETLQELKPDVLVTELFPFGRRKFEFELLPLLEAATTGNRPAPLIVCSVRDILVSRHAGREKFEQRAITMCNRFFDLVLVHSDPSFSCFDDSFSVAKLRPQILHTGFVFGKRSFRQQALHERAPIVVSAGGGLYGYELLRAAIAAHAMLDAAEQTRMKVIAGPFLPAEQFDDLCAAIQQRKDIQLVRYVPDLSEELSKARASISQCGYNTALETLETGIPALIVPFGEAGEDEQIVRARRLEQLGAVRMLHPRFLSAPRLAEEMQRLLHWRPRSLELNVDGARHSAEILLESLRARRFGKPSWSAKELQEWQV
jgi:predicted glycosyltransferase